MLQGVIEVVKVKSKDNITYTFTKSLQMIIYKVNWDLFFKIYFKGSVKIKSYII